jgi:hypothetical protein
MLGTVIVIAVIVFAVIGFMAVLRCLCAAAQHDEQAETGSGRREATTG